ncbi:MAG: NADH-quinone oxidoreductase subunit J [Aeropyrum sp.]|nr:NADH-quinone oxidoreductase subunit J [Aeropyrum sp.]MCE4616827.1 NADH-quinone oxidoreductase subunit J [Aeropyrum sp.]
MSLPLEDLSVVALAGISTLLALAVVRHKDMVYASASLALLGIATALLVAILGYPIVAVFLVIVYVGAAVMFIIVSVSMLGGGGYEEWDDYRGLAAGAASGAAVLMIGLFGGLWQAYSPPEPVSLQTIANLLAGDYAIVVIVLAVGLAATILEGIAIARRGG